MVKGNMVKGNNQFNLIDFYLNAKLNKILSKMLKTEDSHA